MPSVRAIEINVEDRNQQDIATYVQDMLLGTEVGNNSDQKKLVTEFIRHANGVFQWAYLCLPLMRRKLLKGELFDDVRFFLREVPAGLEDVYV